MHSSYRPT